MDGNDYDDMMMWEESGGGMGEDDEEELLQEMCPIPDLPAPPAGRKRLEYLDSPSPSIDANESVLRERKQPRFEFRDAEVEHYDSVLVEKTTEGLSGLTATPVLANQQFDQYLHNVADDNDESDVDDVLFNQERSYAALQRVPLNGSYVAMTCRKSGLVNSSRLYFGRRDAVAPFDHVKRNQLQKLKNMSHSALGLLKTPIENLLSIIDHESIERSLAPNASNLIQQSSEPSSELRPQLWVDKYKPKRFVELLSDPTINRQVLQWIHAWDPVVFNRKPRIPPPNDDFESSSQAGTSLFSPSQKGKSTGLRPRRRGFHTIPINPGFERASNQAADDYRPYPRLLLLCGAPGTGKTTLAHVIARHAGYNAFEINASDDRSAKKLRDKIQRATSMESVFTNQKPNLIVVDEIDGVDSVETVRELMSIANDGQGSTGRKTSSSMLRRPIICICNDSFVTALRPLRGYALIFKLEPPRESDLCARLSSILKAENVLVDSAAVRYLAQQAQRDLRSVLHTLQFTARTKMESSRLTLSHVVSLNIGCKDAKSDQFSIWRAIFQAENGVSKRRMRKQKGPYSHLEESQHIDQVSILLHSISSFNDTERIIDGLFTNYPQLPYNDPTIEKTSQVSEWMSLSDSWQGFIGSTQMYFLEAYLPFVGIACNIHCAISQVPKLELPSANFAYRTELKKNREIVVDFSTACRIGWRSSPPSNAQMPLDVVPLVLRCIRPNNRQSRYISSSGPGSSKDSIGRFNYLIRVMIACGLNYRSSVRHGQIVTTLEPPIDQLIKFSTVSSCSSTFTPQDIDRIRQEITIQLVRNRCHHFNKMDFKKQDLDEKTSIRSAVQCEAPSSATPPVIILPEIPDTALKLSMSSDWIKCFQSNDSNLKSSMSHPIHFRYNEGFSQAVRRKVFMSDFTSNPGADYNKISMI